MILEKIVAICVSNLSLQRPLFAKYTYFKVDTLVFGLRTSALPRGGLTPSCGTLKGSHFESLFSI